MKKFNIAVFVAISTTLACSAIGSASQDADHKRKILVYKDCKIIHQATMTAVQNDAYSALLLEEKKMARLEAPIDAIQAELDLYSEELKRLSGLAFEESEQTLTINKDYLEEQKQAAAKLSALVSSHKKDFAALEAQGDAISDKAKAFEQSIKPALASLDYDNVRIIDTAKSTPWRCNDRI
ncbi:hypothetical protein [Bowmanella dokdonensis]|uniref:Lipoprotein n=1 Tax=Bowmanella dokdonensis TaxID=751969 RepID=A0A939IS09_9ALTE|nr:hypothetical protein [Bowmanella dokdonensis]MBN7826679.1 hypothetical protein [Bowmanella dokdonensis]